MRSGTRASKVRKTARVSDDDEVNESIGLTEFNFPGEGFMVLGLDYGWGSHFWHGMGLVRSGQSFCMADPHHWARRPTFLMLFDSCKEL